MEEDCAGRNQIRFSRHKEEELECNSTITRKQPNCTVKAK